jgi:hypothetical protein
VHELRGEYDGIGSFTTLIKAGEYTANNEFSDFHLYSPDTTSTIPAINVVQATGLRVRDGYIRYSGNGIDLSDCLAVSTSDIEFRNLVMNLSGPPPYTTNQNVNFDCSPSPSPGPYTYYPTDIRLRNVRFVGAAPITASIRFTQHGDIDFDDVDASTGLIVIGSGTPPTGRMTRVKHSGWSGSFTDINQIDKRGMIRTSGQGAYSAAQYLTNVTTTSTTANHVVATYTLPAGLTVNSRDQFIIEASGNNGTGVGITNVAFNDGSAVILAQAIPAAAGGWTLRAVVTVEGDTAISTSVTITYPTAAGVFATSTAEARHSSLTINASGLTMTLQGWIAVGGPTLTFNTISMYPKLYGE